MPTIATMMMTQTTVVSIDSSKYKVDKRCVVCQLKSFERLLAKFKATDGQHQQFVEFYNLTMVRVASNTMAQIHRELNNEFCRILMVSDPYEQEKMECNLLALELYKDYKVKVLESDHPFEMALRLSIAGNIMDYGASSQFEVESTIRKVLESNFAINHSAELKKRLNTAKKVLYLGDNAGEIVFDKLYIETIQHPQITFTVRGANVLNDVTIEDAKQVGMDKVVTVIDNGYDTPSTILSKCSTEFLDIYKQADLIISKGQGNFEGLIDENDARIFFLLMVKCDVVAERLQVEKGSFVVYNQQGNS